MLVKLYVGVINFSNGKFWFLRRNQIAMQIPLKGQIIGLGADLESMNTQFVRLYLKGKFAKNIETLKLLPISSKFGEIPLSTIAKLKRHLTFAKIERDKLLYSLDINRYRFKSI